MRKGFFNGLLAGGLIGAVVAMFMTPQYKKEMVQDTRKVKNRARRVIKGVKTMAEDWMK
ncbi:MAG: hypothetical protein ACYC21_13370 [Eubacteriales bacterium]